MDNNIKEFIEKFKSIKRQEFNSSLRNGYTGLGFTYETLIGKKEDNSYNPDYKGIEIKTKFGYSKSNLTLFTLALESKKGMKYIYNTYAYKKYGAICKNFRHDIYSKKYCFILNKYVVNIKVDREKERIELVITDIFGETLEENIYWKFETLKYRLETKLATLAIIKGYPYIRDGERKFKYTTLSIYRLISFENFLKLVEENKIYVSFNIGTHLSEKRYGQMYDRGAAFKIKNDCIEELFNKIY